MINNKEIFLVQAEPEPIGIDITKTAVLIIDMQNAFVSKGGYFNLAGYDISASQGIIPRCQKILNLAREKKIKIIHLQMGFSEDLSDAGGPNSPAFYKSRALKLINERPELKSKMQTYESWGGDFIEELKPKDGEIVIRKQKHDGFIGTNLDFILRTHDIKHLIFLGIATNICVESTLRHSSSLGYFPLLVSDAVSQMGPSYTQEATIFNVKSTFGWVTTSKDIFKAINFCQHTKNTSGG